MKVPLSGTLKLCKTRCTGFEHRAGRSAPAQAISTAPITARGGNPRAPRDTLRSKGSSWNLVTHKEKHTANPAPLLLGVSLCHWKYSGSKIISGFQIGVKCPNVSLGLVSSSCHTQDLHIFFPLMPSSILKGVQLPSEQPVQLCPTWPNLWLPLIHGTGDISMVLLSSQATDILSLGCDSDLSPASRQVLYHWPNPGECRLRSSQLQHPLMEEGLALPCARLTLIKGQSYPDPPLAGLWIQLWWHLSIPRPALI